MTFQSTTDDAGEPLRRDERRVPVDGRRIFDGKAFVQTIHRITRRADGLPLAAKPQEAAFNAWFRRTSDYLHARGSADDLQSLRNALLAAGDGIEPIYLRPKLVEPAIDELDRSLIFAHADFVQQYKARARPSRDRIVILSGLLPSGNNVHLRQVLTYAVALARSPDVEAVQVVVSLDIVLRTEKLEYDGTPSRWGGASQGRLRHAP